jgi:hypothetical protein
MECYGTFSKTGFTLPAQQLRHPAWSRPPINIKYAITQANFAPLPSKNKTNEAKSTKSSTKLTLSEDYKTIIATEFS